MLCIIFSLCTIVMLPLYSEKLPLPNFNTDLLYEALQPCQGYLQEYATYKTTHSLQGKLATLFNKHAYRFIPPPIQRIAIETSVSMIKAYGQHHKHHPNDPMSHNIALIITLIVRIIHDISATYTHHNQPIVGTFIAKNDVIPIISLISTIKKYLPYDTLHVNILLTQPLSKNYSPEIAHLKKLMHNPTSLMIFEDPYTYITWAQQHQPIIHFMSIAELEPLAECINLIPTSQPSSSISTMSNDDRTAIFECLQQCTLPTDANGATIEFSDEQPPHHCVYYFMVRYHTTAATPMLYVHDQPLREHCNRSPIKYTPWCDPYVLFEDVAQTLLHPHGIAYSTLSTPSGIQYIQQYNLQRELKRIHLGQGTPTARTRIKQHGLVKLWPPEDVPTLRKQNKKLTKPNKNTEKKQAPNSKKQPSKR